MKPVRGLIGWLACLGPTAVLAAVFHVDPASGSMTNTGGKDSPWRTLSEVIAQNRIESLTATGAVKNAGAPVRAGDTLLLREGYHGTLVLSAYYNPQPITVMAEPGRTPRLGFVRLSGVGGWILKGLTISPSFLPAYSRQALVAIQGASRDVILDSCSAYSVPDASRWTAAEWNSLACNGLEAHAGTRITARRNRFRNVDFGMETGDHGLLEYNTVENFSGDGMRCNGDSTVIQYNVIKNVYNVNDNHADGIQAWSTGPGGVGTGVVRANVLRGNLIISREDPAQPHHEYLQGIGLFDGTYRDWIIENNVVVTDHWHGISLYGAVDCRVVNNTVVDVDPAARRPWIMITAHKDKTPSTGCLVRNNLATALSSDANVAQDHNLLVRAYGDHFADFSAFDLRLRAGSPAIDGGVAPSAPAVDRNGAPRPQGGAVDLGAYEYGSASPVKRASSLKALPIPKSLPSDALGRQVRKGRPGRTAQFH